MSKRKRARALHRWEPAHSEKLRKFDLGPGNAACGGADLYETVAPSWGKSWFISGCARSAPGSLRWLLALRWTRWVGT